MGEMENGVRIVTTCMKLDGSSASNGSAKDAVVTLGEGLVR